MLQTPPLSLDKRGGKREKRNPKRQRTSFIHVVAASEKKKEQKEKSCKKKIMYDAQVGFPVGARRERQAAHALCAGSWKHSLIK